MYLLILGLIPAVLAVLAVELLLLYLRVGRAWEALRLAALDAALPGRQDAGAPATEEPNEAARKAKEAIDRFNAGVSAILSYDAAAPKDGDA